MIRRSTKVAFELVAGLIAGVALLAGIAAWRLSAGPISLDFLRPYVERALSGDDGEITVEVARAELAWQGADHALVVRAGDVRARAADGRVVATVPALSVRVSGRALLRGLVAPTEISVLGPSVRLVRTVADNIELALAAGGPGEPAPAPDAGTGGGAVAAFLARELLAPLDDRRALGYLRRVQFLDGSLTLEDHLSGRMLRAPSADIRLTRDEAGIRAGLALALDLAGQLPRVDGDLLYRPGADSIDIAVSFNDIEPAWLKAEAPVMALFDRARLPVSGIVSLRLNAMLEPQILRFDLNGGRGQLAIPEFYDDALAVDRVEARGLVDLKAGRLEIERLFADVGGPKLTIDGLVTGLAGDGGGRMDALAVLRDMTMEQLPRYWPKALAVDARNWVLPNIPSGRVPEARAAIVLRLPSAGAPKAMIESVTGTLNYEELSVHYFRPMPPVTGVSGQATFTRERFDLAVRQGGHKRLRVEQATIKITGLDVKDQDLETEIVVSGPLRDALELLESPPLRYARKIGVTPAEASGNVAARLVFELPLEHNLTPADVKLAAAANLRDIAHAKAMFNLALSQGALGLKLDGRGMTLDGNVRINNHPASLEWRENFADNAAFRRRFRLLGELDDKARAGFGIDLGELVRGTVGVDMTYTESPGERADIAASLDLRAAALQLRFADWFKPSDTPGSAKFTLSMLRSKPVAVPEFTVTNPGLDARGRVEFAEDGAFRRAIIDQLRLGDSDLSMRIAARRPAGYAIELAGQQLDARPFLKDGGAAPRAGPPIRLNGRVGRVLIESGNALDQADIDLDYDGKRPRRLVVDARLGDLGRVVIEQKGRDDGLDLVMASDAAGELLRRLDITGKLVGGQLRLTAAIDDVSPNRPAQAQLEIHDFRAVNAPTLLRILTVASPTGIQELAAGEGIGFTKLSAELKRTGKLVEFSDALAFGPSLGIRVTGQIDQGANTVQLHGTVIPAYSFNEAVSKIPLLGAVLTGGKGIFAANFNARGSLDDPTVTVNPLSSLAPGFLGAFLDKLFNPGPGQEATATPDVFRDLQRQ